MHAHLNKMGEFSGDGDTEEESSLGFKKLGLSSFDINTAKFMDTLENQVEIKRWLDFCRAHPFVICKEYEVPQGILPKGFNGVLIDVKVGGKKRAPDDKIYMAHAELRAKVARGNCVLELNRIEKGKIAETKYIFLIFALKKFSGGLGDEDDSEYSQSQWHHYFIKSLNTTKKVVCTEKANGEAAHISSVKLFGQTYFCIGSKNVHMLIQNADDVLKYKDGRFDFARRISHSFFDTFMNNPEIQEIQKKSLTAFLQSNHFTAVFEMVQPEHQHVVNLSHLKHTELRFICWTKPDLSGDFANSTYCTMPIDEAIEKASGFGLQAIDYEVIEINKDVTLQIEEYLPRIRKEHGYEGKVLYFLDNENCTIGLIKKKTAWYILLRALREKVATFASSQSSAKLPDKLNKVAKRVKEIQSWLGFSDIYADGWTKISQGFTVWLDKKPVVRENIRSNFPILFKNFLMENGEQKKLYDELLDKFDATETLF